MKEIKISCPSCNWEPDGGSYWVCSSCNNQWNTFETMAKCPSCGHQHQKTACIPFRGGCTAYEDHSKWYKNFDTVVKEELQQIEIIEPVKIQ